MNVPQPYPVPAPYPVPVHLPAPSVQSVSVSAGGIPLPDYAVGTPVTGLSAIGAYGFGSEIASLASSGASYIATSPAQYSSAALKVVQAPALGHGLHHHSRAAAVSIRYGGDYSFPSVKLLSNHFSDSLKYGISKVHHYH